MAWTAGSFPQRIRAVSAISSYLGTPFTMHGYLAASLTARTGDVLIVDGTTGGLTRAADNPAVSTVIGVLSEISPKYNAATPTNRAHTTNSSAANPTATAGITAPGKYDDDKSVVFYPWISGNIFQGHFVTNATDDETLDIDLDLWVNSTFYLATNDWAMGLAGNINGCTIAVVSPQATSVTSAGAFVNSVGPAVSDNFSVTSTTLGTKNPLMLVVPKSGRLIAAS